MSPPQEQSSTMRSHQVPPGPLRNSNCKMGTRESCTQLQRGSSSMCHQSQTSPFMTLHTSFDSKGIQFNPVEPMVHLQATITSCIIDMTHQPVDKLLPLQDQASSAKYRHLTIEKGGKANAERECEDSNLCGSQHSPEPADIAKLQELRRASTTRPVCQEIFSQAKPTSARSDLNNFHGLINQDARPSIQYRPLPIDRSVGMLLASRIQTTTSLHILTGLELIFQDHHKDNTGRMFILQAYPSTSFTKCSLAYQDPSKFQDIKSCSATSLLRSHLSI